MKLARLGLAVLTPLLLVVLVVSPGNAQWRLPAGDQVHERIAEVGAFTGWQMLDENVDYASGAPLIGIRGTLNNSAWWSFEGRLAYSPGNKRQIRRGVLESFSASPVYNNQGFISGVVITQMKTREYVEETDSSLMIAAGNMLFHLSKGRMRPFVSVGAGVIDDLSNRNENPAGPLSDPFLEFGVGLKYLRPSGWGWRLEVTDLFTRKGNTPRENLRAPLLAAQFAATGQDFLNALVSGTTRDIEADAPYAPVDYRGKRWLNNVGVTVSFSVPFGFAWKDGDGDGIETRFDDCPTTAPGVVVDALGCGIDSDKDGVFDGLDKCPGTPLGAFVDLGGCPSDTDGDGVFDGIDVADDTPPGALVDERGQHYDTDGDGIFDGLDLCNDTPRGATIDADGCAEDPVEDSFLRGNPIVVQDIAFENGTDEIDPLSYHHVNKVARLVEHWTGNDERPLRVELGVFTDGTGSAEANLRLSQRRADNVRRYLLENFFGMGANNLVAKGYGETRPIADDNTSEGRALNNRLEIRFTDEGDPPEEYDFGASNQSARDETGGTFPDVTAPAAGGSGDESAPALDQEIPPPPPPVEDLEIDDEPALPDFPEDPDLPD